MKKTICDTCQKAKICNTFDKSRGMACMNYDQAQDPQQKQKQEEEEKQE